MEDLGYPERICTTVEAEGLGVRGVKWRTVPTRMDLRSTMSLLASGPIAEQDRISGLTVQCLRPG